MGVGYGGCNALEAEVTGEPGGSDGGAEETAAFCEFDGDGRIGWVGWFGDGIGVDMVLAHEAAIMRKISTSAGTRCP